MRHAGIVFAAVLVTIGLAACGSDQPATTTGSSKAHVFILDEWSIVPPNDALKAGKVAVTATNNGKEAHELVIVRASDAPSLPKKADGSVDEDKIPESKKAGEIADVGAGKTRTKTLDLSAGDYIAFCNIVEGMGSDHPMGSGGMGDGSGMDSGSGMGPSTTMGADDAGMDHVHFKLGMVNYFTVA